MKEFHEDFVCGVCEGRGYILVWAFKDLDIRDCSCCGGRGKVRIRIRDMRQISDEAELDFERKYWQ